MVEVKEYRVTATRSGDWWAISVPEVPGAHGQAKRLDQVADVARDLIILMLDVPPDSFEIKLDPELDDPIRAALDEAERARLEFEESQRRYQEKRARAVNAVRKYTIRDAGVLLGVSFQRASQLLKNTEPEEEDKRQPGTFR